METLFQDLRYGLRKLIKSPGFTFVVVLTLALGTGANSAIFSIVNAALLRPLPYRDADRLVMVWESYVRRGVETRPVPQQSFVEWRSQSRAFEEMAAYVAGGDIGFTISGGAEAERVQGAIVTGNFFPTMGVNPVLGRTFTADEDNSGALPVVLGQRLWQRRFGGDAGVLGKALTLNERSYTIVGVMPSDFDFPSGVELWVADPLHAERAINSALHITYSLRVVARLKPEVTPEQAQTEMDLIARNLQQEYPATNRGIGVRLVPLREELYGDIKPTLLIIFGAVGFLLLIACANTANLFLARAAARQHEIAVRAALGATRLRLVRQLLTESVLLAVLSGIAGLFLCLWLTNVLMTLWPTSTPMPPDVRIDRFVLGFTLAASLLTGLLFGIVPAFQASRVALGSSLKEVGAGGGGGASVAGRRRNHLHSFIVVSEIALALLLLIGAGLMTSSFIRLINTEPGINTSNALMMKITASGRKYPDVERQTAFYAQLLERIKSLPGVRYAGASNFLPLGHGSFRVLFFVGGRAAPPPGEEPSTDCVAVTADYFQALGIPVVKGRIFNEQDTKQAPKVVVIDEALAERYWRGEEPIGKLVNFQGSWREVIGVVRNVQQGELGDAPTGTQMYVPYAQFDFPWPYMYVVVRTSTGNPLGMTSAIRQTLWAEDKDQPVENIKSLESLVSDSLAERRFAMLLLVNFALTALILAAVGIYGVMAYFVSQRTHEIGIRMALGAQTRDVLKLVLRRGLTLTLTGVALGLVGAFGVTRIIASLLYGVSATDPPTLFGASLLLAAVALLAAYVPARRATKIDPLSAIRTE